MHSLHSVGWLGSLLLCFCAFTSESAIDVSNGSRSNTLFVVTAVGDCFAEPGQSFAWQAVDSTTNWFGTNSPSGLVTNGIWVSSPGHEYHVVLGEHSGVAVYDSSPVQSYWFWFGLVFGLGSGLLALGARWVRLLLVGGDSSPVE